MVAPWSLVEVIIPEGSVSAETMDASRQWLRWLGCCFIALTAAATASTPMGVA